MARLPNPGGDAGNWGSILNEFLEVEHDTDGSLKNAGQANGYATLGSDGKVPTSQLPAAGDYVGVTTNGLITTLDNNSTDVTWGDTSVSRGTSVIWSDGAPVFVNIEETGVYAMHATIEWQDGGIGQAGGRFAQLFMTCGFYISQRQVAAEDVISIQNISFTAYLQPTHNIRLTIEQDSGDDLDAYVRMLVTRVA